MPLSRRLWVVLLAGLLPACNDQPTAPDPGNLIIVQAPSPVGAPGWQLIDTLKVQAVDAGGHPQSGVQVNWTVNGGGGVVQVLGDTTDDEGMARALWTLGSREGPNVVRAHTLVEATVEFQSTGQAFKVDRLASSEWMGCGLVDGGLWCWGSGSWARTPPASLFPNEPDPLGWSSGPGLVDSVNQYVDLGVSGGEVCAIDRQSFAWCMGGTVRSMTLVAGLPPVNRIVGAGFVFPGAFCGLAASDSTPWCWRLGGIAAQVAGAPAFATIWMDHGASDFPITACGLRADSTAMCWGQGPLGDGSTLSSASPVVVSGGHRFVQLAVGGQFACGRDPSDSVWCWGRSAASGTYMALAPTFMTGGAARIAADDYWVQLIGPAGSAAVRWKGASRSSLYYPSGLDGLAAVSFSNNNLSCVRLVDGQVYCYDEVWNPGWSFYPDMNYSAVQPVRPSTP